MIKEYHLENVNLLPTLKKKNQNVYYEWIVFV